MARLLIGGCAFINLKTCPALLLSCPGLWLIVAFIHDGVELYELSIVSFPSLIIAATFSPIVEGIWEPGPE